MRTAKIKAVCSQIPKVKLNLEFQRSYWEDSSLIGRPDYIIIGAGLVGLFTACFLHEKHPDSRILILEQGPFSIGASTRNAGFACFGSVSELLMDLDSMDAKEVADLAARRWHGLQLMRSLLDDDETGYEACGGFELFRAQDRYLLDHCLKQLGEIDTLVSEATGLKNIYSYQTTLPPGLRQGCKVIFNAYEGRLDTGKLYSSLLAKLRNAGVRILNGVKVFHLESGPQPKLATGIGKLSCRKILVTVNAFAGALLPDLDVRPARNQVIVTRPIPGLKLDGCFHLDRGYFYFRNIGERLLIGGGRHILGLEEETAQMTTTAEGVSMLLELAAEALDLHQRPEPEWQWSGILGIGSRKLPIIDEVAQNVYCAVRMGGMGVALSSVAGREVSELI